MYVFKDLKKDPSRFPVVKKFFEERISAFYGSQEVALKKIEEARDRKSLILYHQNQAVGIIVYKKSLTKEFETYGIK